MREIFPEIFNNVFILKVNILREHFLMTFARLNWFRETRTRVMYLLILLYAVKRRGGHRWGRQCQFITGFLKKGIKDVIYNSNPDSSG